MAENPEGHPRTALAGERTSFAKFRTSLALDRTTLAWIRTALTFAALNLHFQTCFGQLRIFGVAMNCLRYAVSSYGIPE